MPHAPAGLGAEACRDQLVVPPYRSVEQNERGAGKPGLQRVGHLGAGGQKVEMLIRSLVADAKPERVACTVIAARMGPAFQIPGALAGDGKGQDLEPGRCAAGQRRLERTVDLDRLAPD